jgi:hypothetical protein
MAEQTPPVQTGNPNKGPAIELCGWVRIRSDDDESISAWSRSIQGASSGGITLNTHQQIEPGTVLSIELEPDANGPRRLVVRVLHPTRQLDGRWLISCAFATSLTEAEPKTFHCE